VCEGFFCGGGKVGRVEDPFDRRHGEAGPLSERIRELSERIRERAYPGLRVPAERGAAGAGVCLKPA
jgi:hypothetical protein